MYSSDKAMTNSWNIIEMQEKKHDLKVSLIDLIKELLVIHINHTVAQL